MLKVYATILLCVFLSYQTQAARRGGGYHAIDTKPARPLTAEQPSTDVLESDTVKLRVSWWWWTWARGYLDWLGSLAWWVLSWPWAGVLWVASLLGAILSILFDPMYLRAHWQDAVQASLLTWGAKLGVVGLLVWLCRSMYRIVVTQGL